LIRIYAVISDYRKGHPAILPKPYFTELKVLEGGQGAGTIAHTRMKVMGVEFVYRVVVSEPQPGRVLAEDDEAAGIHTTFTVEPLDGGARSRVTIATDSKTSPGFRGFMERMMNPSITRRIYKKELQQLADYVRGR
jgi:hypothetical protein